MIRHSPPRESATLLSSRRSGASVGIHWTVLMASHSHEKVDPDTHSLRSLLRDDIARLLRHDIASCTIGLVRNDTETQ